MTNRLCLLELTRVPISTPFTCAESAQQSDKTSSVTIVPLDVTKLIKDACQEKRQGRIPTSQLLKSNSSKRYSYRSASAGARLAAWRDGIHAIASAATTVAKQRPTPSGAFAARIERMRGALFAPDAKPWILDVSELDDVVAKIRLHHIADVALFQGERSVFKRLDHGTP